MKSRSFDRLRNIIQDVSDAPDLEQALNIIVQRVKQIMVADAVSIYLRDQTREQLQLMATDGLNQAAIGKTKLNLHQGLIGLVVQQAEPINIEDAHSHPKYHFIAETREVSYHGFLGVPIIQHGQALGVLVVRQIRKRRFSNSDQAFLMTLAAQLAGAISHAEKIGELTRLSTGAGTSPYNMKGLSGSPGIAIGEAVVVYPPANLDAVPDITITKNEIADNILAFDQAISNVEKEFETLSIKMKGLIPDEELVLFDVFGLMLKSESFVGTISERIKSGQWAQAALRETISEHVKQFDAMEDAYFRERVVDIKDLGRRVLMHLQMQKTTTQEATGPVVLVGEEITVSQFSEVPMENLVALISSGGSASSHVAILANALGIPSVMGIDDLPTGQIKGQTIIVDGYSGQIFIKPSSVILDEYSKLIHEEKLLDTTLDQLNDQASVTLDQHQIPLYVNTGLLADMSPPLRSGAEGVGLYRTEIPFLIRDGFPTEEEQANIYRQVLQSFAPRPVTFRTLDIGGDKALPYFPLSETNPFLGWRGIRIMLDHPEIFITQIRALLRSNQYANNMKLMLPMISDVSEVDKALAIIKKVYLELIEEGIDVPMPSVGIMIEVPSAVHQMESFAKRVDFFSIGSNDLTQYLLAVDRNNKQVAGLYDCLHPSVLRSIKYVIDIAHQHNKPVSICGEMAGDPASALALIGMGIDSLSMSTGSLLRVKCVIRSFTLQQAKELADASLKCESASNIRAMLFNALEDVKLSGLVRAGIQ